MALLSSAWDGVNPYLMAYFFESDKDGNQKGETLVKAPLLESNMDIALNWSSPFEEAGMQNKMPSLFNMLQSGEAQGLVDVGTSLASKIVGKEKADALGAKASDAVADFVGKTGITKLNSIQTFQSMPPFKIQVTAFFRAWADAASEVEEPVAQLLAWALPQKLAQDGALVGGLKAIDSGSSVMDALLPSKAPVWVGLVYKGRSYAPLVIESIGIPIGSPITPDGEYIEMSIPLTLCTLNAWDKDDIKFAGF
jgi:hypothetical protein